MDKKSSELSIIIPTLNEENYISDCINSVLRKAGNQPEIIVIDAGSTDRTLNILKKWPEVKLISNKKYRGLKYASLNKGASFSTKELLLFLDADTLLPDNYDKLIFEAIESGYGGGAFELKFDQANLFLTCIAFLNSIRYKVTGRYFGDQAIFCKRELFESLNGFPKIKIMEAAHFCKAMKKISQLKLISQPVLTSSRRFRKGGVLKVFLFDLKVIIKDYLNMNFNQEGEEYWSNVER